MSDLIRRINVNDREIILVGTAHVSIESIAEVENTIRTEMPDCVCVELDEGRYAAMMEKNRWESLDIIKVLKEKKGFLLLANLVLASFQKRMGLNVGVKPGDEMKAAIDIARELNIPTEMVDRPIQVTLKRAWAQNGYTGKSKILASLLAAAFSKEKLEAADIERLKQKSEMDAMLDEVALNMPEVKEVLIDERDVWLGTKIFQASGKKVLAVIGAGHLNGTEKRIMALANNAADANLDKIAAIPPKSIVGKILNIAFPVLFAGLLLAPIFISGSKEQLTQNIVRWLIWNGGLAAVGTLLAFGNILTIVSAFIFAPIATLNPLIGIGMITAIVQATVCKPQVRDMMNIADDVATIKGWYTNRIAKVLLVFILSSVGALIGNIVTIPALISKLF
jgi:traB family protein